MIASLAGVVERSLPGEVVIGVGGVGYRVHVPLSTFARLPSVGGEARLRIFTVVREDEISLYGFATEAEEWLFRLLLEVNGVGPKLALRVLSGIEAERLRDALSTGDTALLATISGVGKKLAQRLVVELREKVGTLEGFERAAPSSADSVVSETADALLALGYQPKIARQAAETARREGAATVGDAVRAALRMLAPKR